MVVALTPFEQPAPLYNGLRMTADEYLALEDDGFRYELIDGVVVTTPSPTLEHQDVRGEIEWQLRTFVRKNRLGWVISEVDVKLGESLVYRPDLIFLSGSRLSRLPKRITIAPDLAVEVLSPSSIALDQKTKLADYQRAGVIEYWIVDPTSGSIMFLRLGRLGYTHETHSRDTFESTAVPGFTLDLAAIRATCDPNLRE